jgi:hypothetical protein
MLQLPQPLEITSGHGAKGQLASGKKAEKPDKTRAQESCVP